MKKLKQKIFKKKKKDDISDSTIRLFNLLTIICLILLIIVLANFDKIEEPEDNQSDVLEAENK